MLLASASLRFAPAPNIFAPPILDTQALRELAALPHKPAAHVRLTAREQRLVWHALVFQPLSLRAHTAVAIVKRFGPAIEPHDDRIWRLESTGSFVAPTAAIHLVSDAAKRRLACSVLDKGYVALITEWANWAAAVMVANAKGWIARDGTVDTLDAADCYYSVRQWVLYEAHARKLPGYVPPPPRKC